jgi:hypothetical protein
LANEYEGLRKAVTESGKLRENIAENENVQLGQINFGHSKILNTSSRIEEVIVEAMLSIRVKPEIVGSGPEKIHPSSVKFVDALPLKSIVLLKKIECSTRNDAELK